MTTESPTYPELRDALFVDIGQRQIAAHAEIERLEGEIRAHHRIAAERSAWQDTTGAHAEMVQVPTKHLAIDAARLRLRHLDEERGLAVDGRHAQLQGPVAHAEGVTHRAATQTEIRDARAAFQAFITPELRAAAARIVEATKAMGVGSHAPELAVAIVNNP